MGDIILLQYGMKIPVDGICLQANVLKADESAMTGESDALIKEPFDICIKRMEEMELEKRAMKTAERGLHDLPSPIIMSGTAVSEGDGQMVAIVVGEASAIGIIRKTLEAEDEKTPLEHKLEKIATDIGKLGTAAAVLVIHVLLARYLIEGLNQRKIDLFGGEIMSGNLLLENVKMWVQIFIVGVAIIVVAVPEGLPLAVMISLAYSIGKMAEDNNDVKRLAACEIMGGANNICSDKTGTLTENIMKVTRIWCGKDCPEITQERKEGGKQGELCDLKWENLGMNSAFAPMIEQAVALNCADKMGATDLAVNELITRCGADKQYLKNKHLPNLKNIIRFPFSSTRKRMSTIVENATGKGGYDKRMFIKGAPEYIISTCSRYIDENGVVQPLNDVVKGTLNNIIELYAKEALRCILCAYKDVSENECGPDHSEGGAVKDIETSGFTIICMFGIMDIIRAEVPKAVADVNRAGVMVRMVTGDNIITAQAIAIRCNIITKEQVGNPRIAMEGKTFFEMTGGLFCKKCD